MNSNVHALEGITPEMSKLRLEPLYDGPAMIQNGRA